MSEFCLLGLLAAGGCGGEFILSAPDVAGLPGETVAAVVRLQRSEFWTYAPASAGAPVTFRMGDAGPQSAKTDKDGYAAVGLPLPESPGQYAVAVHHQDNLGAAVSGTARVYVLAPDQPAAAVDLDSLPLYGPRAAQAASAVARLAQRVQVVYVTEFYAAKTPRAHLLLAQAGFPDGPVLPVAKIHPWYDSRSWPMRGERTPLAGLRRNLPNLRWGIAADADTVATFRKAGLHAIGVVDGSTKPHAHEFFASWGQLQVPDSSTRPAPAN